MSNAAPTGSLKFSGEKTGTFISSQDSNTYSSAILALLNGRHDAISVAAAQQLLQVLMEASSDDITGTIQVLKSFDECRIAEAVNDRVMRT